jgi:hypothetical protein
VKNKKNNVIIQMFDIRPVLQDGSLDFKKIEKVKENWRNFQEVKGRIMSVEDSVNISDLGKKWKVELGRNEEGIKVKKSLCSLFNKNNYSYREKRKIISIGTIIESRNNISIINLNKKKISKVEEEKKCQDNFSLKKKSVLKEDVVKQKKIFYRGNANDHRFSLRDLFLPARFSFGFSLKKSLMTFAGSGFMVVAIIGGTSFVDKGIRVKGNVMISGDQAYENILGALDGIKNNDFESSFEEFEKAQKNFAQASLEMEEMGKGIVSVSKYIPFASKLSSGKNLVEAGEHLAISGKNLNLVAEEIYQIKKSASDDGKQEVSFLEIFTLIRGNLREASEELQKAQENINRVKLDDLPEEKRSQFVEMKSKMFSFSKIVNDFSKNSHIAVDLFGGNGPRKYLFLFQNNNEMRATGGFIGSYGLLEISSGKVQNFFIDGIFNPDGQLKDKIVPPKPIQKISAAWSLHDSNWFPNFPVSAEKAILFYEKTGGPTVDGVITLTPTVMEKLLKLIGPIEMPEYDTVLSSENFIEKTQYEVEVDYDKEENNPKKILSDLAPMVLSRLTETKNSDIALGALGILLQSLSEKHILLYSRNTQLQEFISQAGWSGEVLQTQGDYLSIINSNINGYKTDGVVDEKIEHQAEIQPDGSIIDTVEITRRHNGGNSQFDWWNKVNSNYMRVYVPLGSQLLEVDGQTVEFNNSPLDYQTLKFDEDSDVKKEESNMNIDRDNGVRMYQDAGKGVFAFWTYVSPQEEIAIKLKYRLPFTMDFQGDSAVSYSLLAQKQSGSRGSIFSSAVQYPKNHIIEWTYPDGVIDNSDDSIKWEGMLERDQFFGAVFDSR